MKIQAETDTPESLRRRARNWRAFAARHPHETDYETWILYAKLCEEDAKRLEAQCNPLTAAPSSV